MHREDQAKNFLPETNSRAAVPAQWCPTFSFSLRSFCDLRGSAVNNS